MTITDIEKTTNNKLNKRLNKKIDLKDWPSRVRIVNCLHSCIKDHVITKPNQKMVNLRLYGRNKERKLDL